MLNTHKNMKILIYFFFRLVQNLNGCLKRLIYLEKQTTKRYYHRMLSVIQNEIMIFFIDIFGMRRCIHVSWSKHCYSAYLCQTMIINIQLAFINSKMILRKATNTESVLPTIKRLCLEEEEYSYAQGKTYQQNGLVLKHKLTNLRIKTLVSTWVRKAKRNLTSSQPVHFRMPNPQEENENRFFQWTGWDIQDRFQGTMMCLDIIMSIVTFFLSSFQGFLVDFREGDGSSTTVIALKIIALVIFIIRMLMEMVTISFEDDTVYLYITDIIKKQLKEGAILLHIFSLVMVAISINYPNDEVVGIIHFFSTLFKLGLIRSNLKMIEIQFVDSIKKFYIWNLVRVIIFNIIFAHTIATALLAISMINPDNNWIIVKLVNNNFVDDGQTWYQVYIWSYYWACTIMMTVGFGDICPVDYREAIVVAFIEIISSIVLAYNISEVGSIVTSIRKSSQELQRKLGVLRRMQKKNPIPDQLQCKIESYLTHQISIRDRFEYAEHRAIIEKLPQQLKSEYFLQSNNQLHASLPIFRYFQKVTLSKLNRALDGKVYYPGEYIIKYKVGCSKIIIMKSGQFGLTYWKPRSIMNGTIVQTVNMDGCEATGLLITSNIFTRGNELNYDIVARQYSYGMQIEFQQFVEVLRESSIDYFFYRSVVDKHEKMPNTYEYVKCDYCDNQYHTKFQCTRLHYIPTKSEVVWRYNKGHNASAQRSKSQRNAKPFSHVYFLRKNFFDVLEKALNVNREAISNDDEMHVDQPYDYAMYFKEGNPQSLKRKSFEKSRTLKRLGTRVISSLKRKMVSEDDIE